MICFFLWAVLFAYDNHKTFVIFNKNCFFRVSSLNQQSYLAKLCQQSRNCPETNSATFYLSLRYVVVIGIQIFKTILNKFMLATIMLQYWCATIFKLKYIDAEVIKLALSSIIGFSPRYQFFSKMAMRIRNPRGHKSPSVGFRVQTLWRQNSLARDTYWG